MNRKGWGIREGVGVEGNGVGDMEGDKGGK